MTISELMEEVKNIQGEKWTYLALGRTLMNEVDALKDDIQALPIEVRGSEQIVRDYFALKRSISLYLLQCGFEI